MFLFKNSTDIKQLSIEFERKRTFLYFSKLQKKKIYICLLNEEAKDFIFLEGIVKYIINGIDDILEGDFLFEDEKRYDVNSIYAISLKKFSSKEIIKRAIDTCVFRDNGEDELLISSRDLKPEDYNHGSSSESMSGELLKYNDKFYEAIFNCEINIPKEQIFEDHNFKINSGGWKKITVDEKSYLENPEKDVWEFLDGDYKGEQLFTWEAAMREADKYGKRIPTDDEFSKFLKINKEIPNTIFTGIRKYDGTFSNVGTHIYLWSSSSDSNNKDALLQYSFLGWFTFLREIGSKMLGLSVRCLKD